MLQTRQESIAPDIVVLHLTGRVSMGRPCQEIEAQIDELIRQKSTKLILDLSEVQRVDSTGFGTIVMCAGKFKKAGGDFRVAGAKGIVEEKRNRRGNRPHLESSDHHSVSSHGGGCRGCVSFATLNLLRWLDVLFSSFYRISGIAGSKLCF